MSDEAALLAAIAAHPDEDTPRLAYADWLDEHQSAPAAPTRGRKRKPVAAPNPRAELIRAQIELTRLGDYDTSAPATALRDRVEHLLEEHARVWTDDFSTAVGHWVLQPTFRRGFPDHLGIPARWFVEHGEAIRRTLPLLTSVSIYRLNGWGERLAKSPHLRGLRELKVQCWIGDADVAALVKSSNLKNLERLTLWVGGWERGSLAGEILGTSKAWPQLKQLTLVWDRDGWFAEIINGEVSKPLAVSVNPLDRTFPFAADFDHTFFVGKLPDGRQVFAACAWEGQNAIPVLLFDAAGNELERQNLRIRPKSVLKAMGRKESPVAFAARRDATFQEHRELVCKRLGAEPADIRVREFDLEGAGIGNMSTEASALMYQTDDPDENFDGPHGPRNGAERGIGGRVERWLDDHGWFTFTPGEGSLPYFIDGRGRIVGR